MALFFGHALPYMATNNDGNLYAELLPADQRVEAASGTQEIAGGCLDSRVVDLRSRVEEQLNANLLFNSSMAGATGSVLPTNWASGSVSGLTYTISSASTVQGFRSIEWTVSGTALSDGDIYLACEPMQSGSVVAQIPNEYVGSMYCAKVSGTIKAAMVLQTLTQNFVDGAVQETKTKDLAAVTGQTFVRIEPNSVKTDIDLENRVNLRLYQPIASGEVVDFTIRVAAPQVEAGFVASPFISTVSGAVSEVRGRPSILVVPQLTKSGVVYPQLPTVSGADFTFTRATTATRVNASGLIESVASGLLRLDYPIGGGCPAALIEPSGTNLVPSGLVFGSAAGVLYDTAVSDSPAVGINSARITKNEASGTIRYASQTCSTSALAGSTTYTISRFFKYDGYAFATSMEYNNNAQWGGTAWNQVINIASSGVTLGASSSCTGSVENYGNGWYRVAVRITTGASPSGSPVTYLMRLPADLSTGQGFLTALPQLETGAIPTSYIPTTTASATRNADVCTVSGVSGYIGQTEGTIYWDIAAIGGVLTGTGNPEFGVRDEAGTNWIALTSNDPSNPFRITARTTTPLLLINYQANIASGKAALAWSSAGLVLYVNGVSVDTSATNPNFSFSRAIIRTTTMSYKANAFAIYTTRLSNDQLASLTRLT